jgi:hypothetical protein
MRLTIILGAVAVAILAPFPNSAQAQSCAGFTDVAGTSPFCPNVEWLKNRGVTLGCTSTTLYCPTDPVTRLSMAAFMNRLGKALSPEVLTFEGSTTAISLPTNPPLAKYCATADSTIAVYPRSATVYATLTGLADANAVAWKARAVFSTDGGATWQTSAAPVAIRASSAGNQWSGTSVVATLNVQPGLAYRFAIEIGRDDLLPGTTGNFTQSRCIVTATVDNRNGTSTPFDLAASANGRGQ